MESSETCSSWGRSCWFLLWTPVFLPPQQQRAAAHQLKPVRKVSFTGRSDHSPQPALPNPSKMVTPSITSEQSQWPSDSQLLRPAQADLHLPPATGPTCAASLQPSGRPCVGRRSEARSRHQMEQDDVFRRNWLKLLTASTVSSCGHASIPHIRTGAPPFFSSFPRLSVWFKQHFSNQRGFRRSVYFYMRAMKVYIELQLPK